jgi:hypothetical protein
MADSLPSADPRARDIVAHIAQFEASVALAEPALAARDWKRLERLLSEQHRLTHALRNLLEETSDVRPAAFSAELDRRIASIKERRADQLRRLVAFNHLVRQRLTIISRSREMGRFSVASQAPARILDTVQ